jgi:inner membrane transporter RhtA
MIVGASLTIQLAAGIAHSLFAFLTPAGTSAMRFALGALILTAIVRPVVRGRDAAAWRAIAAYGASLAALNITFFQAISLIPMGIAVTLSFIAPLVMALARSRRHGDLLWALLAGAGIATLSGVNRPESVSGMLFAIASGCAWVGVAYAGRSVGRRTRGLDGLALAIPIAALITLPFGINHFREIDLRSLAIGLVIAVGGLILPFALELEGLRRLEPRTVAVIYSIDPANAAFVGLVLLGERLTMLQVIGVVAVVIASAGATAAARDIGVSALPRRGHRMRPVDLLTSDSAPSRTRDCHTASAGSRSRPGDANPPFRVDDAIASAFSLAHPKPSTAGVSGFLLRTGR